MVRSDDCGGKKHAEECTKAPPASLLLFILFDALFLVTLLANLMKIHTGALLRVADMHADSIDCACPHAV